MNKSVLKNLSKFESNVELSELDIELATAKDLNALFGKAVSMANTLLGGVPSKIDELKKYLIETEKQAVKLISDLDGALIDFEKVTRELGIDAKQNKTYNSAKKELDALYKGASDITKTLQAIK